MVLKTAFTGLPPERIDKVMTKVEGSHLITLASQSPSAMTAVNVITCKDPGTAHDVLDMSEDIQVVKFKSLANDPKYEMKNVSVSDFVGIKNAICKQSSFMLMEQSEKIWIKVNSVRAVHKQYMIELILSNYSMTNPEIIVVIEDIISRLKNYEKSDSPADVKANFEAAINYIKIREDKKARQLLEAIAKEYPQHLKTRYYLALVCARNRDYAIAWEHILIADKIEPKNKKIIDFMNKLAQKLPRPAR